jgi:hypothetical protein
MINKQEYDIKKAIDWPSSFIRSRDMMHMGIMCNDIIISILFWLLLTNLLTGLLHLTMGGGIPSARHSNRTLPPSRASIGRST